MVRNRVNALRSTIKPAPFTTNQPTTEQTKVTRKTLRRKIPKNPNALKKVITSTATTTTTTTTLQSDPFNDAELTNVLSALTSARPRKPTLSKPVEETTRKFQSLQPNKIEHLEMKAERKPSSFDEILEQQYKIKGIDVSETYEDDERLIGVLGSQVIYYVIYWKCLMYFYLTG